MSNMSIHRTFRNCMRNTCQRPIRGGARQRRRKGCASFIYSAIALKYLTLNGCEHIRKWSHALVMAALAHYKREPARQQTQAITCVAAALDATRPKRIGLMATARKCTEAMAMEGGATEEANKLFLSTSAQMNSMSVNSIFNFNPTAYWIKTPEKSAHRRKRSMHRHFSEYCHTKRARRPRPLQL